MKKRSQVEILRKRIFYKNLVYDLAHHESPIAQWLERPTGIWKVMGSPPVGGSEKKILFLSIST